MFGKQKGDKCEIKELQHERVLLQAKVAALESKTDRQFQEILDVLGKNDRLNTKVDKLEKVNDALVNEIRALYQKEQRWFDVVSFTKRVCPAFVLDECPRLDGSHKQYVGRNMTSLSYDVDNLSAIVDRAIKQLSDDMITEQQTKAINTFTKKNVTCNNILNWALVKLDKKYIGQLTRREACEIIDKMFYEIHQIKTQKKCSFDFSKFDTQSVIERFHCEEYTLKHKQFTTTTPDQCYPEGLELIIEGKEYKLGDVFFSYGSRMAVGRRLVYDGALIGYIVWEDIAKHVREMNSIKLAKFKVGDRLIDSRNYNCVSQQYTVAEVNPHIYTLVRDGYSLMYRHKDEVEREFKKVN